MRSALASIALLLAAAALPAQTVTGTTVTAQTITITGAGFVSGAFASMNGVPCISTAFVSSTQLIAQCPVVPPVFTVKNPVQHGVKIAWTASASPGISGYRVKRSTVPGSAYTTIATLPTGTLGYTDSAVTVGSTYFYVVTAYSATQESANSDQVSATIP